MKMRNIVINEITKVFRLFGAEAIDTPVFELKEILVEKYGEDSKLIYDLANHGGELLALRYDLTVPFARYCSTHDVEKIKRFQIGKVYRRDEPQMNKGRYREFYQCDFDILGQYNELSSDVEVLLVINEVLKRFDLFFSQYTINVNHRSILNAILSASGVDKKNIPVVCSSIDKLDKQPWEEVKNELIMVKQIDVAVVDRIKDLILFDGSNQEIIQFLKEKQELHSDKNFNKAIHEFEKIFFILDNASIKLNLSLARGLDYYTGIIYEVTINDDALGGLNNELKTVLNAKIPYMVIMGEDEIKNGIISIKNMEKNFQYRINFNEVESFFNSIICS
ncbi:histidine--tRNA ligase, cytoplasmic-like [Dermatophagoides farinae]|uniref:histidine--tRNA ligase, cytoplasmic-like n=1 Tax=Dermatophagoides farinae TaxID=6954 RepID=UPI003F616FE6